MLAGVEAHFVGHPRAPHADALRRPTHERRGDLVIMPGSRRAELRRHAPVLRTALLRLRTMTSRRRRLLIAPTLERTEITHAFGADALDEVDLVEGDALDALADAELAWVASGTAVTECLLMGVVPLVFYRVNPATFLVARQLVRTPWISMANILAREALVPELVQDAFTAPALLATTDLLLRDHALRSELSQRLETLARTLTADSGATSRTTHRAADDALLERPIRI